MNRLIDIRRYEEVIGHFSWDGLWELFDGDERALNLAHECIDRHRHRGVAISVKFAIGGSEHYDFTLLADLTGRFANWLGRLGIEKGDRVAVILDPSRSFYVCLFGIMKYGAIAVPLSPLFGPEGLGRRVQDCRPRLILTGSDPELLSSQFPETQVVRANAAVEEALAESPHFTPSTAASDLALFQYTSGTTRQLPEAVKHTHRAVVTSMVAALYGVGLRPGDRYFCPSSPAWGHGLAHGTLSPLALGIHTASYSGKFDAGRMFEALQDFEIDNMAAAPTVFRMLRDSGLRDRYRIHLRKLSYTGEPMDRGTAAWLEKAFGVTPCSMYGTTEVGVLIVNYPGFAGYRVKPGALGKPVPGRAVAIVDRDGHELPPNQTGEIAVRRRGQWFYVKDLGYRDPEGYFYIEGRSDDAIISAGWTMSAVEIEQTLLTHPAVLEAAVVGAPDPVRGQVARAYIVARDPRPDLIEEIQSFMKDTLSRHEYPRQIQLVDELPRTPVGKVDRMALRDHAKRTAPPPSEARGPFWTVSPRPGQGYPEETTP